MKLSISLSTLLFVLPALVSASSIPVQARGLNGDIYMPRHHARQFGRQRQGGFRQGGGRQGGQNVNKNKGSSSVAAAVSTPAVGSPNASTASCPAPTTVTVTAGAAAATAATDTTTDTAAAVSATVAANKNGGNKNGGNNNNQASATATATSTSSAAAVSATVAANNGAGQNNDPQTSLTLLSNLVAPGLAQDGQTPPVAGQVASLTTTNNFINFCAGKTITNGKQVAAGSCNPIPMGDIIPKANMPSCKFASPANQDVIPANQPFTVKMNLNNMQAGVFTNAQKTYYMAPQQLNGNNILIGHSHFVIQKMGNFADPTILDPTTFAFFKGINTAAANGQLTADVTAGLPAGNYRLASINTDSNHAPAIAAVAQHGWLDDIVYFTAK